MENATPEKWVGIKEISEHLDVTVDCIRKWIKAETIPCHRIGRLWKFRISEIDDWVLSGKAGEK